MKARPLQAATKLHHLAIQVVDLDRAEAFYAGLLGLPVLRRWEDGAGRPRSVWLQLDGGAFLALERCDEPGRQPAWSSPEAGLHLLAVEIAAADRAAWEARLDRAGHPKVQETDFTFYVRDPDGNRIGLSHHPTPAPGGG